MWKGKGGWRVGKKKQKNKNKSKNKNKNKNKNKKKKSRRRVKDEHFVASQCHRDQLLHRLQRQVLAGQVVQGPAFQSHGDPLPVHQQLHIILFDCDPSGVLRLQDVGVRVF